MQFPLRRDFIINITDDFGGRKNVIAEISFKQPTAMESFEFQEMIKSQRHLSIWFNKFLKDNTKIIYRNYRRRWYDIGIIWKFKLRRRKRNYEKSVWASIYAASGEIMKQLSEKYFYNNDSIFRGLAYPRIKGDKNRKRKSLFLEGIYLLCGKNGDRVQEMLKTHTLEQISVLMDTMTLVNNEQVTEYLLVNDKALQNAGYESVSKKDREDIMSTMKRVKEQLKKQGGIKS